MHAYRATQAYQGAAVAVPPLKAVVMLFDGAILFLQKSVEACEAKRFEEGHTYLIRAISILRGLSYHLIVGSALGDRLYKTYNGLIFAALSSFNRPDAARRYGKIIIGLTNLRDAWKYVADTQSAPRKAGNRA
jgi:flagellar protein FliS